MDSRPHILWIVLDSVRVDHTSVGGHHRETTPTLGTLAEADTSTVCQPCLAHGKYTLTSTSAMLSGSAPTETRLGYERSTLPDGTKTAAERFSEIGYQTGGFSSNRYVSHETGLDRGFDRFDWIHPSTLIETAGVRNILKYMLNIRRHSAGFTTDPYKHSTPYLLNEVARDWLTQQKSGKPIFSYVHYNEPHRPYYPPLPYLDTYTDGIDMSAREAAQFSMRAHENVERFISEGRSFSRRELDALRAMYDAEIRYTDEQMCKLIETFRGIDDRDCLVVVTADHGELFGEYGLLGHKFVLHDELTSVPMVVDGLDSFETGKLVQHADVMKTILSRVGADTDGFLGYDLDEQRREFAVSQHHEVDWTPYLQHNPGYETGRFHTGAVSAIRTDGFRLTRDDAGDQLFELPDETTDVSGSHQAVSTRLGEHLSSWLDRHTSHETEEDTGYSEKMEQHLSDLGYVENPSDGTKHD